MIWTLAFWMGAGERAIKTFAQTELAVFGVGVLVPIVELPWLPGLGMGVTAALLSVLTSIGNADFTAGTMSNGRHEA
jgi:hypothetical protein